MLYIHLFLANLIWGLNVIVTKLNYDSFHPLFLAMLKILFSVLALLFYIYYKKISFEKHILQWIENCQKEVRNITNLNEAFENYKDIIKKITNNYEGRIKLLENELSNNKKYYELAKEISEAFQKAKNKN